jgi:hypothetical protein
VSAKKAVKRQSKWKVYTALTLLIAAGTLAFDAGTMYASYPTEKHREVARKISALDTKAYSLTSTQDPSVVLESDEYKTLQATTENVYSTRMGIGSGVLGVILGVAVVVAVYRYLRRNLITRKPVGATVLINTLAAVAVAVPSVLLTPLLTGMKIDTITALLLIAALPFALAFGMLLTFLVAKIAEWHYNRSHGFIED